MSEPTSSSKDKLSEKESAPDEAPLPDLSPEDIERLLESEDPEFMKSVSTLGEDKSLSVAEIHIDDAQAVLNAEVELWKSYTGPRKWLLKFLPFLPRVTLKLKIWNRKLLGLIQSLLIRLKNFLFFLFTDLRVKTTSYLKEKKNQIKETMAENSKTLQRLGWKAKAVFISSYLFLALTLIVIYFSMKGGIFPAEKELFLRAMGDHASERVEYESGDTEPYLNNVRAEQNVLLTRKIFVNLRTSSNSGPNPMGAFEFFVEGFNSDVIVEIKKNEAMVSDQMRKVIEEMTYDELTTAQGKKELCARLQKEISTAVLSGEIKHVRLGVFIIKP